jgi:hypothetical protein
MTIVDGSTKAAGIFSRAETATLELELYDPDRRFDPLNAQGPFMLSGSTRLVAGVPVEVVAQTAVGADVATHVVFRGTADQWAHPIERVPVDRRSKVSASGAAKRMVNLDWGEQPEVGGGDTTRQRIDRIVTFFDWAGPVEYVGAESAVTLEATTLAQSMWELVNRTIDDELGYVHVTADGTLRVLSRDMWATLPPPVVLLGCSPRGTLSPRDIVTDVAMSAADEQLRNAVYAARTGGEQQVVKSDPSIAAHGGFETSLRRTDLGLNDDGQVATWAQLVVVLYAFPRPVPASARLLPGRVNVNTGPIWRDVLDLDMVTDPIRIVWDPDDGSTVDQTVRVVGVRHSVTPGEWAVEWEFVDAWSNALPVWHIGPHVNDKLDDGNVIGSTGTPDMSSALREGATNAA